MSILLTWLIALGFGIAAANHEIETNSAISEKATETSGKNQTTGTSDSSQMQWEPAQPEITRGDPFVTGSDPYNFDNIAHKLSVAMVVVSLSAMGVLIGVSYPKMKKIAPLRTEATMDQSTLYPTYTAQSIIHVIPTITVPKDNTQTNAIELRNLQSDNARPNLTAQTSFAMTSSIDGGSALPSVDSTAYTHSSCLRRDHREESKVENSMENSTWKKQNTRSKNAGPLENFTIQQETNRDKETVAMDKSTNKRDKYHTTDATPIEISTRKIRNNNFVTESRNRTSNELTFEPTRINTQNGLNSRLSHRQRKLWKSLFVEMAVFFLLWGFFAVVHIVALSNQQKQYETPMNTLIRIWYMMLFSESVINLLLNWFKNSEIKAILKQICHC